LPLLLEPPTGGRQKVECRIQDSLHKCGSPRGLYDPHGSLAG
jgi:hypothetical protein